MSRPLGHSNTDLIFEFERWIGTWMAPDTFLEPKWTDKNGTRVDAPDELTSWVVASNWDYASTPLDFLKPDRMSIAEPGVSSLVRRRTWTAPRLHTRPFDDTPSSPPCCTTSTSSSTLLSRSEPVVRGTWQSDSSAQVCACGKEFGTFGAAKRHHCRECGHVACGTCTIRTKILLRIPNGGACEVLKVCETCFSVPPRGSLAVRGASTELISFHVRFALITLISSLGARLSSRAARDYALTIASALSMELSAPPTTVTSHTSSSNNTPTTMTTATLGDDLLQRADLLASVITIFIARRIWDARTLALMKNVSAAAGVPFSYVTRLYHLTLALGKGEGSNSNGRGGGAARPTLLSEHGSPATSGGSSSISSAWAVPIGLAAVATGGGAVIGLAALSVTTAAALHGLIAFKAASIIAASGTALTAPHAAAAAKGLEEIEFECLSHETLMSPRARRALYASRERTNKFNAGSFPTSTAPLFMTGGHNADVVGVTIGIAGLAFNTTTDDAACEPSQRLLADYATPFGGVENADASVSQVWAQNEIIGDDLSSGWWGRSFASTHAGELWTFIWGWTGLNTLDKQLSLIHAKPDAEGIDKILSNSAGAVATSMLSALAVHETALARCLREADAAGIVLAHALLTGAHGAGTAGRRPVTLIGVGLGGRVAFSAAREIGRISANFSTSLSPPPLGDASARWPSLPPSRDNAPAAGAEPSSILCDIILLAPFVDASHEDWRLVRAVCSGRIAIGFSTSDELLLSAERIKILKNTCGLRPLGGGGGGISVPFAFDSIDGTCVASICDGIESWDITSIAPTHTDIRKRIPTILKHMCVIGIDGAALFEDVSSMSNTHNINNDAASHAPGQILFGLLQLKKLFALFSSLKAATKEQIPDFATAAPALRGLLSGVESLLSLFPGAKTARQLLDEASVLSKILVDAAIDDAITLGVVDVKRATPWITTGIDNTSCLSFSNETMVEIRAAVDCVDAASTESRDRYLNRIITAQLLPLTQNAFVLPKNPTLISAAALNALVHFAYRFSWIQRAQQNARNQFSTLWPESWYFDSVLSQSFYHASFVEAQSILSALRGAHEEQICVALRETRRWELEEIDRGMLVIPISYKTRLEKGTVSSLFSAALSPEVDVRHHPHETAVGMTGLNRFFR